MQTHFLPRARRRLRQRQDGSVLLVRVCPNVPASSHLCHTPAAYSEINSNNVLVLLYVLNTSDLEWKLLVPLRNCVRERHISFNLLNSFGRWSIIFFDILRVNHWNMFTVKLSWPLILYNMSLWLRASYDLMRNDQRHVELVACWSNKWGVIIYAKGKIAANITIKSKFLGKCKNVEWFYMCEDWSSVNVKCNYMSLLLLLFGAFEIVAKSLKDNDDISATVLRWTIHSCHFLPITVPATRAPNQWCYKLQVSWQTVADTWRILRDTGSIGEAWQWWQQQQDPAQIWPNSETCTRRPNT